MAQEARKAAAKADETETPAVVEEKVEADQVVIEMAADRDSMRESIDRMETAIANLSRQVGSVDTGQKELHDGQTVIQDDLNKISTRMSAVELSQRDLKADNRDIKQEVSETRTMRDRTDALKEEVVERAEITGNFIARNARRAGRELKPGHVNRDHVKGAIVGNLASYFALVGAAQFAPVAVGNAITTALFI